MSRSSEAHRQYSQRWSDEQQEGRQQEMEELFLAIEHENNQEEDIS